MIEPEFVYRERPLHTLSNLVEGYMIVFRRVWAGRIICRLRDEGIKVEVIGDKFAAKGISEDDKKLLAMFRPEVIAILKDFKYEGPQWESKSTPKSMTDGSEKDW